MDGWPIQSDVMPVKGLNGFYALRHGVSVWSGLSQICKSNAECVSELGFNFGIGFDPDLDSSVSDFADPC